MLFKDLNLIPSILSALEAEGYSTPTPVQAAAIPPILERRDLLGCAQTGTGKTAAFALPILQNLSAVKSTGARHIRALILTPTRELAVQIGESFAAYGRNLDLRHTVIFGGVGESPQKAQLRKGVDIVVATPGRLIDLLGQRALTLNQLEIFTLDEADRMLDMGFVHDVRRITALLPAKRQTLLFSATMPEEIRKLADGLLRNPIKVEVAPVSSTADKIDQGIYFVKKDSKPALLRHILSDESVKRVLVFTRTKHGADRLRQSLERYSIPSEAIHGNKSQGARQRSLANFKDGTTRVLVATDLAARGIDVEEITHVVNYDLPAEPETYVHRIGRTARAGASGISLSFCGPDDRGMLQGIERLIKKRIRVVETPVLPESAIPARETPRPHHENRSNHAGRPQHDNRPRSEERSRPHHENRKSGEDRDRAQGHRNGNRQGQGHRRDDHQGQSQRRPGRSFSGSERIQNDESRQARPIPREASSHQHGRNRQGTGKSRGGHQGQGKPFQREYFSNDR